MQYGILGTTQALHDDGTAVSVGGPRLRALLAALALRAGRAVPAWALIEDVWAEEPPADPQDALQTLVARLRRALGPDEVVSAPDGYRLTSRDTDLSRFQALAAEAPGGEAADDADALRAALALWRGPALADLPARADAAARYEAQRDAVQRRLLAAELALGRAEAVLQDLAELVERRPLDEPLQALRLRALRAAGRAPEALLAYEGFRLRLADELGTDPGPELRAVHAELLLAPEPETGPGPEREPSAPASPPTPVPASVPEPEGGFATNLRPRLTSFVGRAADLAALRSALAGQRLLTLTGPGGSGKTRLAQQAAEAQSARSFPDGVWLVELAPLNDARAVTGAVLSALGLRATLLHVASKTEPLAGPGEAETPMARLLDHCAGRRLLIVLDNCEHLIQAAAEFTEQIISACPGVSVLATSREPLGVPGEAVLPVEPLPDPAALQLLAERGAVDPARDPEACAEICRRLDGLPLAIELAAARLRALTPRQLADRLDSRFQLLTGGSRTHLPRQQTLRAVVDWSWELLDKPERLLLARLSVFAGGWTLDAAEQICADEQLPYADIAALLASLVDKSLVQASLDAAVPRYRMLETIHEYAAERFQESADSSQMTDRHICHYRELARTTDPLLRGSGQLAALTLLETEHDNLRAALRRAVATGAEQEALCLCLALCWFWQLRNYEPEGSSWVAAVAAIRPQDPFAEPSDAPLPLGPLDLAPPWSPEVLAEARRCLALWLFISSQEDFTRPATPEAVATARKLLDSYRPDLPQSCRLPALLRVYALMFTGDYQRLTDTVEAMVDGCREQGLEWELGFVLQMRCKMANDQPGGLDQARQDAQESLDVFTRLGDSWGMAEALSGQAENAGFVGDFQLAVEACRRALELARSIGAEQDIPLLEVRLGDALISLGHTDEGEQHLITGISDARVHGPRGQGAGFFGTCMLAMRYGYAGRYQEARELLEPLIPQGADFGMANQLGGMVDGMIAWMDAKEGDPERGLLRLRQGLVRMNRNPLPAPWAGQQLAIMMTPSISYVLLECARLRGDQELARLAARLIGTYDTVQRRAHHHLEQLALEANTAGLRALLGDAAYEAAHAEGTALDAVGVVAQVRGDDPDDPGEPAVRSSS
ncbi:AAA family ATPase [Streptacidiphilus sp. PB12-B1b]|uniref:AfsR/SARP family transcriptional regulator n=1 Tax=Streptacidiphilus sp. PB12-B1b TaxID=2705012 RepID=UPI001CDC3C5A|nr:BTAD domain-containing putative transcriptional regulator [Streptacidiphilus sp. PB12-B1b]QMU75797.1 AAA family ATPase [Streptacidiphilus sp. PB12-B1b]